MPSQDRSIERVKDLDRLMVRVSAVFLAIVLGFAPSWFDKMITDVGDDIAAYLFSAIYVGSFAALFISFSCFLRPRHSYVWRVISTSLLLGGMGLGMLVLVAAYVRPQPSLTLQEILAAIGSIYTLIGIFFWREIKDYFREA